MSKSKQQQSDELAVELADVINKKFKTSGYKTAYFLDTATDAPNEVRGWVQSGSDMLDLAMSNRPAGGFPVGRIIEITGLEASGKSLLAAHALANTQRQDGLAVYIDTEMAVSREFLEAIGVDLSKMLYIPLETIEEVFETIESITEKVRKSNKDRLVTIIVDSVMGASTKGEKEKEYDKDGYATQKAIILSKGMRKLTNMIGREKICLMFTNQLRTRLGVAFGDPYTTSGGKAIAFHSSVRLRLKSIGQIKAKLDGVQQVIGIKTRVQVIKNRLGPPLKSIDYDIYFDSGIDNYGGWLTILKDYKLISQAGAWYTYTRESGEEVKFQSKDFASKLIEDPDLKDEIYKKICDAYIVNYKANEDFGIDDIEVDSEFVNEEG